MPQQYVGVIKRANSLISKASTILPTDDNHTKPFYFVKEIDSIISELAGGIAELKTYLKGLSSESDRSDKYANAIEEMEMCKAKLESIRKRWR